MPTPTEERFVGVTHTGPGGEQVAIFDRERKRLAPWGSPTEYSKRNRDDWLGLLRNDPQRVQSLSWDDHDV